MLNLSSCVVCDKKVVYFLNCLVSINIMLNNVIKTQNFDINIVF